LTIVEQEFEDVVDWVTEIEQKTLQYFGPNDSIEFKALVPSMLQLLENKDLPKDLHLQGLKILRKIVEIGNSDCHTPAADWETEDWIKFALQIETKQNLMVELGCVEFACKHLSAIEDSDVLEECLLLCIALLLGGNAKTQESFLAFMRGDDVNRMLVSIRDMLLRSFDSAKKFLLEKNTRFQMVGRAHLKLNDIVKQKLSGHFSKEQSD